MRSEEALSTLSNECSCQEHQAMLGELRALREELSVFRQTVAANPSEVRMGSAAYTLSVSVERDACGRKPYRLSCSGAVTASIRLSKVRLAVLFALLVDLQRRSEGQPRLRSLPSAVSKMLAIIDPSDSSEHALAEKIRVTMYRCVQVFNLERRFFQESIGLTINEELGVLELMAGTKLVEPRLLSLNIATDDDLLHCAYAAITSDSQMTMLRSKKALFVPPEDEALDRLLLELYRHDRPMTVTSFYFKPAMSMYPQSLLQQIGAPQVLMERSQMLSDGLRDGRLKSVEVLNTKVLEDISRYVPGRGFAQYPAGVDRLSVIGHVEHLIHQLERYSNYELVLTPLPLPFHFVTYEVSKEARDDLVTIFVRNDNGGYLESVWGFGICDQHFAKSITSSVANRILKDPDCIRDKKEVKKRLSEVAQRLMSQSTSASIPRRQALC